MKVELVDPLGWVRRGYEIAGSGSLTEDDLSLPTVPGLLNLAGYREIRGSINITWRCCGIYEILVNGGGSVAEVPREPTLHIGETFRPYPAGKGSEDLLGQGPPVNPFSWDPLTFTANSSGGLCAEVGGKNLCIRRAMPWSPARGEMIYLKGAKVRRAPLRVGFMQTSEEGDLMSLGRGIRAWVGESAAAALSESIASVIPTDGLEFRTGLYDLEASLLYPLRFLRIRLRPGEAVEANAIVLRGDSAVSLVSPAPFRLSLQDGYIKIEAQNIVHLIEGGEVQAFRGLLESLTTWEGKGARPLGVVEPGPASLILHSVEPNEEGGYTLRLVVANPTDYDGEPELRLNFTISSAELCSHLGCLEIPGDRRGLVRIPAPSGCYCQATVRVRGLSKP